MTTRKDYWNELAKIRQVITEMGEKTAASILSAVESLVSGNMEPALMSRQCEKEIDAMYSAMDEKCITLLATQQPLASDLRFIVASLKIASEIERIADYGNNIAKIVQKKLAQLDRAPVDAVRELVRKMGDNAAGMLSDAVKAYQTDDTDLAIQVIERDAAVNAINKALFRELVNVSLTNPKGLETILELHTAIRYIERVADRSTNVAEWVFYVGTGYPFRERK